MSPRRIDYQRKGKSHLTLVALGHTDSGKSTLMSHLAFECGGLDKRYKNELIEQAQREWGTVYSRFLITLVHRPHEMERGITVNICSWRFYTEKYFFTIIDTPGHRDFIKNMITGTTQADIALLVVDATIGAFECGISLTGQTREHAIIAFVMGVRQMIVCVNKFDDNKVTNFSELRYKEIYDTVRPFLGRVGYNLTAIPFIPMAALTGENLFTKSEKMPWYKGPCFLEALDQLTLPNRPVDKPLRIPFRNVYQIGGVGTVVVGRVESGVMTPEMTITIAPPMLTTEVKSVEMHREMLTNAVPGDIIGFNIRGIRWKDLQKGFVAGATRNNPPCSVQSFEALILILNHPTKIMPGYTPVLHCHTASVACKFERLIERVDKETQKVIEKEPLSIKKGQSCLVKMVPTKPLSLEPFKDHPQLGRFTLRDHHQIVAVGIVKSITSAHVTGR